MLHVIGWSCDGTLLAGLFSSQLSSTRSIVIWDVKTRAVKAAFPLTGLNEDMEVFRATLSWSPVDPHMLAVFNLNTIAVIDVSQGKILYQLSTDDPNASQPVSPNKGNVPLVLAITWSPDGRYIAASYASSNKIYLWDTQDSHPPTRDGAHLQHLIFPLANDPLAHSDSISDLSWSPNGRFLASASFDKSIKVWKVDK
jgi:WD40 repeat protein